MGDWMKKLLAIIIALLGASFAIAQQIQRNAAFDKLTVRNTATFTGLSQCKSFENVQCVDSTLSRGGRDIGAEINLAYAALPAAGGTIWIAPKSGGSCYTYTTPILLNVLSKYPLISSMSVSEAACLNYTPTTATSALTMDYSTVASIKGAAHGLSNIMLINNGCRTTAGCGSSAIGLNSGSVNSGTYQATFANVTIYGFNIAYQNLNNFSTDVLWTNPNIQSNSTAILVKSPTGVIISGGTIAGNGTALKGNDSTSTAEVTFLGTQFFANTVTGVDFSSTSIGNAIVNCMACHWENSPAMTTAHFVLGRVNYTQIAGIMEEDNPAGTFDNFTNTFGFTVTMKDVLFGCAATCTAISTLQTPTRASVSGTIISPEHFTGIVNGTNAALAVVQVSSGSSATGQLSGSLGDFPMQFPKTVSPSIAGATDLGSGALPWGSLWLGTAATNNFKFQSAATTAARVIYMPDPLGAVNMPYVIASGTSSMTGAAIPAATCQTAITTFATNTLTTDSIEWAYATAPTVTTDALLHISPYVTANNVNFTRCNPTASSIAGTSIVINWRVIR
jgi:hypothetical protein